MKETGLTIKIQKHNFIGTFALSKSLHFSEEKTPDDVETFLTVVYAQQIKEKNKKIGKNI